MSVGRPRRYSSNMDEVDEDGNILWHGVKLGEFWKTDMQVAINDSNRRKDSSFTIRMGKTGTSLPYQQPIPADFARYHKNLFQESLTLECPTGQTWSAVLNASQQVVRFGRGWRQFSTENHLQEGYQLLFTLKGSFHFLVQFFDHLGKRCTSYPPLPGSLPLAETQRQPDLHPGSQHGFQQVVDGGQASHRIASHRHGSEGHASAAVPLMVRSTRSSAIPLTSHQDYVIHRQCGAELPRELPPEPILSREHMRKREEHTFYSGNDSEDTETEDEETEELAKDKDYIFLDDSENDDVLFCHPPVTKPPLIKQEQKVLTLNEVLLKNENKHNQASPAQSQYNNSSSDDEPPDVEKKVKKPVSRKKVTVKRRSPPTTPVAGSHNVRASSGSSPAMRLLQKQGCMRFSDIVSKCERRDVSDRERRVVEVAAKRFASMLGNEKFLVVLRDGQVYQGFHLAIPEKILVATGTEHENKVEICLLDREQALYKTHWTRQNLYDTPFLDRDAWAKFALDHTLEEGDVCVFQLLPQLLQPKPAISVLFIVHIFRVVETPVGQLDHPDEMDDE